MSYSAAGRVARAVDVGDDKAILFMEDGAVRFRHVCDRTARDAGTIICSPALRLGEGGHTVASGSPLTILPSLHCPDCGTHGWVRDGRWEPC